MKSRILSLVLLAVTAPGLGAEPSAFLATLDRLLPPMGAADVAERQAAQQEFQDLCFALGTPGRDAERDAACKEMLARLGTATPKPARLWLLKQLQSIGKVECVQPLSGLLGNAEVEIRQAALRALTDNPSPEATRLLELRLKGAADSATRLALIHALAYRASPTSVPFLETYLPDADADVAAAAAQALGRIATPEATEILIKARSGSSVVRKAIADAAMSCADRFLAAREATRAGKIYFDFSQRERPRPVRLAGLRGRLAAAGPNAARLTLDMLGRDDPDAQAVAAQFAAQLPAAELTAIAGDLSRLPASSQVMLLAALAAKGDRAAAAVARQAAKSDQPDVKLAGIAALARLGGAADIPGLVADMLSTGPDAAPARETLERIFGQGVEQAILAAVEQAEPAAQKKLLELVEARRMTSAVPLLLKFAESPDAELRSRAMRALGVMASPEDAPAVIALLLKAPRGRERDDAERAVMLICARIEDPHAQAAPVLEAIERSPADRLALLPVLGRIGGPKALAAVQAAIQSEDAELQDAGVRALCNWPDNSVAPALLKMSAGAANESHRVWALRAYVRVMTPRDRRGGDPRTLAVFQQAFDMATRDDERRFVLSRAAAIRTPQTVAWLLPYLDTPPLATDAARSIVDLAHRKELFEPNKAQFTQALQKVIATCKDKATVERADRILRGL